MTGLTLFFLLLWLVTRTHDFGEWHVISMALEGFFIVLACACSYGSAKEQNK